MRLIFAPFGTATGLHRSIKQERLEDPSKTKGAKKSTRANQYGKLAQFSEAPETKEPEEADKSH
jgi:hypothetical protein